MEKKHLLIVEDETEILSFISDYLKEKGYTVSIARDGLDGLNKARHHSPDLIVLDVNLPKMNGFQVCRLLKYDQSYSHIPIILWTWKEEDKDRETGMSSGADAYIPKPFSLPELIEKIESLLQADFKSGEEAE